MIVVAFATVQLTVSCLSEYSYGVWVVLYAMMQWIYQIDLGVGNGLRNRLTEALAANNLPLARIYIATSFALMALIVTVILILAVTVGSVVDWYALLNVDAGIVDHLPTLILILTAIFCVSFVLKLVTNIYLALQLPAMTDALTLIGSVGSLIAIAIMSHSHTATLYRVAIAFAAIPTITYAVAIPLTFRRMPHLAPRLSDIRIAFARPLLTLGAKFMLSQLSFIIVCLVSNLLVSHICGPEEVTVFNLSFKYFSLTTLAFGIVLSPVWSGITDAYSRGDISWIIDTRRRLLFIWMLAACGTALLIVIAPWFYSVWLKGEVVIPQQFNYWWGIYVVIGALGNIFTTIVNGFGKVMLQSIISAIVAVIFIPLAITLGHDYGAIGIIMAMILMAVIDVVWGARQATLLISHRARGLWAR